MLKLKDFPPTSDFKQASWIALNACKFSRRCTQCIKRLQI